MLVDATPGGVVPSSDSDGAFESSVALVCSGGRDAPGRAGGAAADSTGARDLAVSTWGSPWDDMPANASVWLGCTVSLVDASVRLACTASTCVSTSPQTGSTGCGRCTDVAAAWWVTGVSVWKLDCFCAPNDASFCVGWGSSTCTSASFDTDSTDCGRSSGAGSASLVMDSLFFDRTTDWTSGRDRDGAEWFGLFCSAVGNGGGGL